MPDRFTQITTVYEDGKFSRLACGVRYGKKWMLKGLQPQYAASELYNGLLRKEFDILMQVRHPGIVGVVGMEQVDELGCLCIVEEWIDGVTLQRYMEHPGNAAERVRIVRQVLSALAHCHRLQVTHRDLKPGNIMVTSSGDAMLIDFGLSDTDNYSLYKGAAGTLQYIAPEQLRGEKADARADVYSMGILMMQMRLPSALNPVIKRAKSADRNMRYANASDMLQAVDNSLHRHALKKSLAWGTLAVGVLTVASWMWGQSQVKYNTQPIGGHIPESWHQSDTTHHYPDSNFQSIYITKLGVPVHLVKAGVYSVPGNISRNLAVDLGLSVMWAPFNVGAEHESGLMPGAVLGYGFKDVSIVFRSDDGACTVDSVGRKSISGTEFDIARRTWGNPWRIPTKEEFEELFRKCEWRYFPGDDHTIPGYIVTGRNGKSIFFPFSGFRYGVNYHSVAEKGFYWTANRFNDTTQLFNHHAFAVVMNEHFLQIIAHGDVNGFSIRPVLDK